ncbi:MAG: antirestriction protein [Candidatus Nealsonbacteria bacterium]|nr:antirestriction protein [Candidatus Nealsonbacteria bacterium]
MQFYRKAESAATLILEAFRSGNLPKALAPIFVNRKDDTPCRRWSWSNQLLAALAGTGDARGYRQWQAVGRQVKKGAKSFPILCPCIRKFEDKESGEEKSALYGFTSAPVFRLEDTEGEPLPGPDPETVAWLESLPLRDVAQTWGVSVDCFNGKGGRYYGYYKHGDAIALGVENLSTWCHELVHAADDKARTITRAPGQQPDNEIVAELGGAILLEILGHETESDRGGCWDYVQRYAEKAKLDPIQACQKLLKRTCDCVALILDTAEAAGEAAVTAA